MSLFLLAGSLLGSSIVSLIVKKSTAAGIIASSFLFVSAISGVVVFICTWNSNGFIYTCEWFQLGNVAMTVSVQLIPVTLLLLLVVVAISFLVHVFSVAYMAHDEAPGRYYSILGFFTLAMVALVVSGNLFQLFFFWELVGVSSYFLVGHWRSKPEAAKAATKAFIMNRVGDVGLLAGIALIWTEFNTLDILQLQSLVAGSEPWLLTTIGLCLFMGVIGKSAQFPLFTWLPDAMEGPTPVSALIHAATMVAAGVFLLTRMFFVFTPDVLVIIATTGAITAVYGAWHALWQHDIKKVLAYSTVSQLGVMVLAIGAGTWMGGFLHLFTHAFFKAALFLCAGAIIHHMHSHSEKFDSQNMMNMGGLQKKLPLVYFVFLLASAGLTGVPLLAGFLSKEVILAFLLQQTTQNFSFATVLWLVVFLVVSFTTVVYTFRMIALVFWGEFRSEKEIPAFHLTKNAMRLPLVILAAGCTWVTVGLHPFSVNGWILNRLGEAQKVDGWVPLFSISWVVAALLFAYRRYAGSKFLSPDTSATDFLDRVYARIAIQPTHALSRITSFTDRRVDRFIHGLVFLQVGIAFFTSWIDRIVVDGVVNASASTSKVISNQIRSMAGGQIQRYLLWSVIGFVIFLFWLFK